MKDTLKEFFYKYFPAFAVILILFLFFFLLGCSPKIVHDIEKVYVHDTTRVYHRDSIYFEKADTLKQFVKGDTIYYDRIKWRYEFKIKEVHDTITNVQYEIKEQEIPVKYTPKFYKVCTWLWWILIVICCLILIMRLIWKR